MPKQTQLTASVDSLHGFKETKSKKNKQNSVININPTHQFMEVIRAANASRTFDSEDFGPAPPPNKFVYSRDEILNLWKAHELRPGALILPETTTEKNLIPVCKDEAIMREYKDALHGNGKWAALQSPARSSRSTRGRGARTKVTRGRGDLLVSTDSARHKPRDEKKAWPITQSTDSFVSSPENRPPPVAREIKQSPSPPEPKTVEPPKEEPQEPIKWQYIDDQGKIEGPFETSTMEVWFQKGYFLPTLKVKTTKDDEFFQLSQLAVLGQNPFQPNVTAAELASRFTSQHVSSSSDFVNPGASNPAFSFASILGISNDEALKPSQPPLSASGSSVETDWNSPKVWKVDQVESQWKSTSQATVPRVHSPWNLPSQSTKSLKDIQEQQMKEQKAAPLRTSGSSQPNTNEPSNPRSQFSPWGVTSTENVSVKVDVNDLFSSVNSQAKGWASSSFGSKVSLDEIKQEQVSENQKKQVQQAKEPQNISAPAGWSNLSTGTQKSLLQIQQEEAAQRRAEQQRLYEEHMRQNDAMPGPFTWRLSSSNETLSLEQIQQNQLQEACRKRELARQQAKQMAEAQQTAMWSTPQSSRPLSLLEIQEQELRQKELQQKQQQQRTGPSATPSLMWGASWGVSNPSLAEIREQQAQSGSSSNTLRSSSSAVSNAWSSQSNSQSNPAPKWSNDEDSLLWDPSPAPEEKPSEEFPSLGNQVTTQPKSPSKGRVANKKQPNKKGTNKSQPESPQRNPKNESKSKAQQNEPKGKGRRKKNKKKVVDASEFFSFGSSSLAGRAIEGPDYE